MRIDADTKDIEEARMIVVKRVDKFCFFVIFIGKGSIFAQSLNLTDAMINLYKLQF